jgi:hypothetical protein
MNGMERVADGLRGMHVSTAPEPGRGRAHARLLADIAFLGGLDPERPSAAQRLDDALGPELAQRLVGALAGRAGSRRQCEVGEAA